MASLIISEVYGAKLCSGIDLIIQVITEDEIPMYYIYSTFTNFEEPPEVLLFKSDNVNTRVLELIDLIKEKGGSVIDEEFNIVGPNLSQNDNEIYDIAEYVPPTFKFGTIDTTQLVKCDHELKYEQHIDYLLNAKVRVQKLNIS